MIAHLPWIGIAALLVFATYAARRLRSPGVWFVLVTLGAVVPLMRYWLALFVASTWQQYAGSIGEYRFIVLLIGVSIAYGLGVIYLWQLVRHRLFTLGEPGPRCPRCRYDLSGTPSNTCSECGQRFKLVTKCRVHRKG